MIIEIVKYFLIASGIMFWLVILVDYLLFRIEQRAENGE